MADMKQVTDADFDREIEQHDGLAMVDFWATWCGPCRIIAPHVEQLATEYDGRVKVAKLDVDQSPETPARFGVRSIPSVLFFKDGKLVDSVVGAVPKGHLAERIEKHLG
jgi:thioredoxin 1